MSGFSDEQRTLLETKLDAAVIKTRKQAGRDLSYIESWHVIAEANRIFGFDGWSSETVEVKMVAEHERTIGRDQYARPGWGVSYTAKVRVTAGGVVRDGVGAGHGIDADLGLAHESAIKEAESDARKRALMTFGNQFGLALYDKMQEGVDRGEGAAAPQGRPLAATTRQPAQSTQHVLPATTRVLSGNLASAIKRMEEQPTFDALLAWYDTAKANVARLSPEDQEAFMRAYGERQAELGRKEGLTGAV